MLKMLLNTLPATALLGALEKWTLFPPTVTTQLVKWVVLPSLRTITMTAPLHPWPSWWMRARTLTRRETLRKSAGLLRNKTLARRVMVTVT